MNEDDAAARRAVWLAFSELCLDTETGEDDYRRIAAELAASGYDLPTLESILLREVHPVTVYNLMSVAGEWAGFDPDTLFARIQARLRRPRWLRLVNPEVLLPLPFVGWRFLGGYPHAQWRILVPLIVAARAAGTAS